MNTEVEKVSDVFLYKLGYYDYHKLNMKGMLGRYADREWYQIDILIEWSKPTEKRTNLNGL